MNTQESFRWAHQYIRKHEKHTNMLTEKFELSYPNLAVADAGETPVNILCLDGGGLRGYALPVLLSAINEKYGRGKESADILEQFDLVAGTSVGGVFALVSNRMKSLQEACDEFTDNADEIRERAFSQMKVKTLLKTGASVAKEDQMGTIIKERWGDTPLLNSLKPKAMVLAASRSSDSSTSYAPIVLRTYNYPDDHADAGDPLVYSSAALTAAQAAAATLAIPLVVHSVEARLEDNDVSLMDGCLYGNCPLHVAIDEARQLFPRRPLGVVLSIGFNDVEDAFRDRVIKVARAVSPDLHFHRLAPSHITTDFKAYETSLQSVVEMEERVHDFIWTDSEVSSALEITMKKLYSNKVPTPEYLRRQALLKNKKSQERVRSRQKVREMLKQNDISQSRIWTDTANNSIDLSISSSTINLKQENNFDARILTTENNTTSDSIASLDTITTRKNDAQQYDTVCNKQWWAMCHPCFALCNGCKGGATNTHDVDDDDIIEVKVNSMNRAER